MYSMTVQQVEIPPLHCQRENLSEVVHFSSVLGLVIPHNLFTLNLQTFFFTI
jgi:hypothetical protein